MYLIFLFLIFPYLLCGYIDPGMGSWIFQVIISGILGAIVAIKMFWKNIKMWFTGKKEDNKDEE